MYENIGYDWRFQYDVPAEFDEYLAKKKPAYFTFEDIETVRSFYCECYEPLRRGFKWMLIRWSQSETSFSLKPYDKVFIHSCLEIKDQTTTTTSSILQFPAILTNHTTGYLTPVIYNVSVPFFYSKHNHKYKLYCIIYIIPTISIMACFVWCIKTQELDLPF